MEVQPQPARISRHEEINIVLPVLSFAVTEAVLGNPGGAGVGHVRMEHIAGSVRQRKRSGRVRVGQVSGQHRGGVGGQRLNVLATMF
jgi:hypothetical protein